MMLRWEPAPYSGSRLDDISDAPDKGGRYRVVRAAARSKVIQARHNGVVIGTFATPAEARAACEVHAEQNRTQTATCKPFNTLQADVA